MSVRCSDYWKQKRLKKALKQAHLYLSKDPDYLVAYCILRDGINDCLDGEHGPE